MKDRIYAIVNLNANEVYVGRTYRTLVERWLEHLKAAADSNSSKTLYERLRHAPDAFEILECEYSETASEAEWVEKFKREGYTILNDTGANRTKPKARDTSKEREWRALNMEADQRLNACANSGNEVRRMLDQAIKNGQARYDAFLASKHLT